MDELEWLKENSPPAQPSRETTRRHRTQLRAAIASEGADGTQPRRPHRRRPTRHRVLVTTTVVVALCAVGAGVVALTSSGGDEGSTVGAPAASGPSSTAPTPTCSGSPPAQLAVPDGFGTAVAGPGPDSTPAPLRTQQVTHWSSGPTTIEQRWPADAEAAARLGSPTAPTEGIVAGSESAAKVDAQGVARRTSVFSFAGQSSPCTNLQVTVSGHDASAVDAAADALTAAPFRSNEPLVTTTGAAASAPSVVGCEAVARSDAVATAAPAMPAVATVGGSVQRSAFSQPADALADFLPGRTTLAQRGYRELRLQDSSVVYVKDVAGNVVTTVHVVLTSAGWTVTDWAASGC